MATRKKGAAGSAPAAAAKAQAPATGAASVALPVTGEKTGEAGAPPVGNAAAATEGQAVAHVIVAQQPGQIASALAAPVLETGAPEGGVISEAVVSQKAKPETSGRVIKVQSVSAHGRWRIGRRFTREVTEIDVDTLSDDEFERLLADPQLVIDLGGAAETFPADSE